MSEIKSVNNFEQFFYEITESIARGMGLDVVDLRNSIPWFRDMKKQKPVNDLTLDEAIQELIYFAGKAPGVTSEYFHYPSISELASMGDEYFSSINANLKIVPSEKLLGFIADLRQVTGGQREGQTL